MKTKISNTFRFVLDRTKAYSPDILTGMAVAGVVSTTVLGAKATIKAVRLVDKSNNERNSAGLEPMSSKQVVKLTWRGYVPTAVLATVTVSAILGANTVSNRRNAALVGLYSMTERNLKEYQDKVVEFMGEEKAKEIKESITDDKIKENPVSETTIIHTGGGDVLCYDELSGRYFNSSKNKIDSAINDLNKLMLNTYTASLNEYYEAIGLPSVKVGEELGWNSDELISISYNSKLTDTGEPVLVVGFYYEPFARFQDF